MSSNNLEKLKSALPSSDVLSQCMHCGMCLAVCPTYDITKVERSSPRGRIRMIKSVAEGTLEMTPQFIDEINFCLDCQACETACPAGVQYGKMVESARDLAGETVLQYRLENLIKKFALNVILSGKFIFHCTSKILAVVQKLKIDKWLAHSGIVRKVLPNAPELLKLLPEFGMKNSDTVLQEVNPAFGQKKYTVAFLTGCLMDTAFCDTNLATVQLLQKLGCEVIVPKAQVCCGSLHAHNGEMKKAHTLAKKNLDAFSKYQYDFLVSNSAGCGAFMKEYAHIFHEDPAYKKLADLFSGKVLDVTEFLTLPGVTLPLKPAAETITYHDACHLCHTQKIVNQPRAILSKIPKANYVPLEQSTWCCGSAGIYNILRNEDSMKFLAKKMENIKKTGAEVVITGNPGCFLQLKYGAEKENLNCRIEHTAEYLNKLVD